MGSFRRGIRIFRSQDANFESRPSFLRKAYPIKIYSPPSGVGSLDFKKRSTPSSSSLLLVNKCKLNVNRNANENVNRNAHKNVNRNVSREPNFRYTTILLTKMKENDSKSTPSMRRRYVMEPPFRKIENPRKSWDPEVPGAKIDFHPRILIKNYPFLQFSI